MLRRDRQPVSERIMQTPSANRCAARSWLDSKPLHTFARSTGWGVRNSAALHRAEMLAAWRRLVSEHRTVVDSRAGCGACRTRSGTAVFGRFAGWIEADSLDVPFALGWLGRRMRAKDEDSFSMIGRFGARMRRAALQFPPRTGPQDGPPHLLIPRPSRPRWPARCRFVDNAPGK